MFWSRFPPIQGPAYPVRYQAPVALTLCWDISVLCRRASDSPWLLHFGRTTPWRTVWWWFWFWARCCRRSVLQEWTLLRWTRGCSWGSVGWLQWLFRVAIFSFPSPVHSIWGVVDPRRRGPWFPSCPSRSWRRPSSLPSDVVVLSLIMISFNIIKMSIVWEGTPP